MKVNNRIVGGIREACAHDSAVKHVTGKAVYIDDIPEPKNTLHLSLGMSEIAKGKIKSINLDDVNSSSGVVGTLLASDIPGVNDFSPTHSGDDLVLADNYIEFAGQPIFAVIAESYGQA